MVDKAAEDFADAYNCVFSKCSGFQSPLPLARIARRDDAVLTGIATLGSHSSPAIDRLIRFDMSRVNPCASLWHLCSADWKPVILEPAAYSQLALSPCSSADVCGVLGSSSPCTSSATFFHARHGEVVARTVEDAVAVAVDHHKVWWVAHSESGPDCLSCSGVDTFFSSTKGESVTSRVTAPGQRGILLDRNAPSVLYGSLGLHMVDVRDATNATAHSTPIHQEGIRSAGLVDQYCVVAQTDEYRLVVTDLRMATAKEPVLQKSMTVPVRIRSHRGLHCALLVSQCAVATLDVSAAAMVGAMDCTEGHFLDAELMGCCGRAARVCATTSTGMLFEYTLTY